MPPSEAGRLARQRANLREAGEYAAADELRERIRVLGFEVVDRPDGYDLRPITPKESVRICPEDVESVIDRAFTADWSVHWLAEGWPEDIVRGIESFRAHQGARRVQQVVVEAVAASEGTWPDDVELVSLATHPGFGAARNAGLFRSTGHSVLVVDGSIEATGDVFAPLEEALSRPTVGICGPFCLVTDDLREFRSAKGAQVDAVEGYLMAFRRDVLERGVAYDPRFRFYRAADIDLSFQVKALGLDAVNVDVPAARHEHRAWSSTPETERARLSKRNLYRFLDRFRGRTDLLVSRRLSR